jgi:hypothetical protein
VNSSIIYLIHCKNFCKCCNVPPQHNKNKIKYSFRNVPTNILFISVYIKIDYKENIRIQILLVIKYSLSLSLSFWQCYGLN